MSLSQKPEGLGLGLAAAFALTDAASWLGILQVQTKGRQAGDPPSPRQGGLPDKGPHSLPVSFSQKPKGLGLGLAAAFTLGDTASWLGIWVPCFESLLFRFRQKVSAKQEMLPKAGGLTASQCVKNPKVWDWGWLPRSFLVMLRPGWGSGSLA